MTKIPEEHTAAKALEESFRTLGEQRTGARRRRPSWGTARIALAALTSLFVVAGVATGTKVFLGDGGVFGTEHSGLEGLSGHVDPAPAYRQLARSSVRDPVEREPWGLRLFRSAKGYSCFTLGRVVDGRLGVIRGGQFREIPTRAAGICGDLEVHHYVLAARTYPPRTIPGGRTLVYGVVDRTVTRLAILSATGRRTPVRIASDGTFLVLRTGTAPFHLAHMVIDGSAGRQVQLLAE
ncbi:MAG: hypothetical protein JWQ18_1417 [Conexibacter sp.]|nr:hypothetical protein [Conexibacter sp.]